MYSLSSVFLVFSSIFIFAVPLSSSFLLLPVVRLFTGGGRDLTKSYSHRKKNLKLSLSGYVCITSDGRMRREDIGVVVLLCIYSIC
jgi:hypothetical protein